MDSFIFLAGVFCGVLLGVFLMALVWSGKRNDLASEFNRRVSHD
jgi:hypothetical protein